MSLKIVTSLDTLFRYAAELGKARQAGASAEEIARLEKRHDEYQKLCLASDECQMSPAMQNIAFGKGRY